MPLPHENGALVLHCDNVWIDPPGRFEAKSLVLAGGRIAAIRDRQPVPSPDETGRALDLGSTYLMPGLINTHVHLEFSASVDPLVDFRRESDAVRLSRAYRNARSMLMSGVTTLRDCGSSLALLALSHSEEHHMLDVPRLLLSGPPITVPRGHLSMFGGEVTCPKGISALVKRVVEKGARTLKLIGSGGSMTPDTYPENVTFPQEIFRQVADAAREYRIASAAHVLATESVRRAALARFDSLEHCAFFHRSGNGRLKRTFDPAVAEILADCGVSVMPNLSTATRSHGRLAKERTRGNPDSRHELEQHEIMLENFGKLVRLGIPMVCGTDAGVRDTPFEDTWIELELMARSGLSNVQTIRSVTLNAARVLKLELEIGRIAVGYSADLIALKASPLTYMAAYRDPVHVFCQGHEVKRPQLNRKK